jgi:hypothetical protein
MVGAGSLTQSVEHLTSMPKTLSSKSVPQKKRKKEKEEEEEEEEGGDVRIQTGVEFANYCSIYKSVEKHFTSKLREDMD